MTVPAGGRPAPGDSARRELRLAVVLCGTGSGLVLLAASRDWLRVTVPEAKPLPPTVERLAGAALVPGARPLALVGLAGIAALFAARRSGRILVGLLVLLAGSGVIALALRLLADQAGAVARVRLVRLARPGLPHLGPWPWVCLLGGLLIALAGLLVLTRGRRWATLSAAYDAPMAAGRRPAPAGDAAVAPAVPVRAPSKDLPSPPAGNEVRGEKAVWDALDRGEDPTG